MKILLWCSCAVFLLSAFRIKWEMENPLYNFDLMALGFCLFVAAQAV